MNKLPCVYLLASKRNGTLYAGVTSDLVKRVWEHKNHVVDGFTKQYKVDQLVWYEVHETMETAIQREKAIKEWQRAWKLKLIEDFNPDWKDLYALICHTGAACVVGALAPYNHGVPLAGAGRYPVIKNTSAKRIQTNCTLNKTAGYRPSPA